MSAAPDPPSNGAKTGRDSLGRFGPGNPGGPGRPKHPPEFDAQGPAFLLKMARLANDDDHPKMFEALKICIERIYGKGGLDEGDKNEATQKAAALEALVDAIKGKRAGPGDVPG
jgi:hypothetical protein